MVAIKEIARQLNMVPEDLQRESLRAYLEKRLHIVESELFLLGKKFGVKDVFDLDKRVQEGKFHEEEAFEDYFKFDNLEAERDRLKKYLDSI